MLVSLKGETKVTDFGVSAGLDNSVAMVCYLRCIDAYYCHVFDIVWFFETKNNCLVSLLLLWMELEKRIKIKYLLLLCQCATFVGTVTYMSPERIRNETYSFAADIWSLGLAILECGSGKFPYSANEGPANLMLQVSSISFSLFCCIFPHAYHLSNYFFFNVLCILHI